MEKVYIDENFVGTRIDQYMALLLTDHSRSVIQNWIEEGKVTVNGKSVKSNYRLKLEDAIELASFIKELGYRPEQVQDFIPTPGTLSTCMYYSGLNPLTGEAVYTAKRPEEKRMQRALMQYWEPRNHEIVRKALHLAHREDLIGYGPACLVRPASAPHGMHEAGRKPGIARRKPRGSKQ